MIPALRRSNRARIGDFMQSSSVRSGAGSREYALALRDHAGTLPKDAGVPRQHSGVPNTILGMREHSPRQSGGQAGLWTGVLAAVLLAASVGCGGDAPVRQQEVVLHHELQFQDGTEAVVAVDSVSWQLGRIDETIPGEAELEGIYQLALTNLLLEPATVRFELRFLDEDGLLVDVYFPFGQPVELAAGERRTLDGGFLVRLGDLSEVRFLRTMEVVFQREG